jgi:hypothetical protein
MEFLCISIYYLADLDDGTAFIKLTNVPYNCVVFLTGSLSLIPPPNPPPPPPNTPSYLVQTIVQVPMYYGIPPNPPIPVAGTIYYNNSSNLLKVYDSVQGWISTTPLPPP